MDSRDKSKIDSLCPAPWKLAATSPLGSLRLCCDSDSKLNISLNEKNEPYRLPLDWSRALNSKMFQSIRSEMLEGNWPSACFSCKRAESRGVLSTRKIYLERHEAGFKPNELNLVQDISQITELDLRLGNICNLKCRMCGPYSSSSWLSDYEELLSEGLISEIHPRELNRLKTNWQDENAVVESLAKLIPNLKHLYITGGEPTLSKGGKLFLEKCIEQNCSQNIHLRYNTNGSFWNEDLVKLWPHFASVFVKISIDGIGPINEYIRYPSKWGAILDVLTSYQKLKSEINLGMSIQVSLQAYNAFRIKEIISFFSQLNLNVVFTHVERPNFLSMGVLPSPIANKIKNELAGFSYVGVDGVVQSLNSRYANLWGNFKKFTNRLDQMRGQNVLSVLPEFEPFWDVDI